MYKDALGFGSPACTLGSTVILPLINSCSWGMVNSSLAANAPLGNPKMVLPVVDKNTHKKVSRKSSLETMSCRLAFRSPVVVFLDLGWGEERQSQTYRGDSFVQGATLVASSKGNDCTSMAALMKIVTITMTLMMQRCHENEQGTTGRNIDAKSSAQQVIKILVLPSGNTNPWTSYPLSGVINICKIYWNWRETPEIGGLSRKTSNPFGGRRREKSFHHLLLQ